MKKKLLWRIVLDIVMLGSAVVGAWWIVFPVGLVCAWKFKKYFEFPLAALVFDVIYSAPRAEFFGFEYLYTAIALVLLVAVIFLRSKVRKNIW